MKLCKKCGLPVKIYKSDANIFEGMHWICFHYEFEHGDYDPDEPCDDPSCPWNRINNKNSIVEHNESHIIRQEKQFIGFTFKETETVYYPSVSFKIAVESFDNFVINPSVWIEKNELIEFLNSAKELELTHVNETSHLSAMSPDEFDLVLIKDKLGRFKLKYKLQRTIGHEYKAEIAGVQELSSEEVKNFLKYFKEVASFA